MTRLSGLSVPQHGGPEICALHPEGPKLPCGGRLGWLQRMCTVHWPLVVLAGTIVFLYSSVVAGLIGDWFSNPDYSHGFFVPLLSAYLVWRKRHELAVLSPRPNQRGIFIVLGAIGLLFLGSLGAEPFLSQTSLIVATVGLILYFEGGASLRMLCFPLMFLFLMVPLPTLIYNQIVLPLQFFASSFATHVLDVLNLFPVLREGNILILPRNRLEVVEACSGIRSLMSLITLAIGYGYFAESNRYLRVLLVVAMIPLAVVSNGSRVVGTALLTYYWGPGAAKGFLHSFSGWVIFLLATVLLLTLHWTISHLRRVRFDANATGD